MAQYPAATQHPVQNHGGAMTQHLGLVLHVQEGNNSLAGYFNNPATQVSSHFWISKAGAVEQYVDTDNESWAQMAGNSTYLSVETEGYHTEALTDQQVQALAKLFRWCHDTYQIPLATSDTPGQPGLAWHGMGGDAWGGHFDCPGDLRKNARPQIIQLAGGAAVIPSQPSQPAPQPQPTPQPSYPPYTGRLITFTPPNHYTVGNDVRQWQQQMQNRGWHITVDGVYGPASKDIAEKFQREKGLTVDGIIGPETWKATWLAPVT